MRCGGKHTADPPLSAAEAESRDGFGRHLKPRLFELLQAIGLDVVYRRGEGDYLYYRDQQGREVEVLDLVGGYGSLLLGHSHPALVAEAQRFLASARPIHGQGSVREPAGRLARELSRRAQGDFCVVFANSGAEAVEAAMKHAMLETGSKTFLVLERGFHGNTLGAVQLTANEEYRAAFELTGLHIVRVRPNDIEHLEAAFTRAADIAGFIFEPVQGEGGIWPLQPAFAKRAAELCAQRHVPLIADECQTGVGRTGRFFASEALGVRPDYLILSKALGGGLAKISAVLIRRKRYVDVFDLKHTSTYAEDDYSCAIALRTLEIVDNEATLTKCVEKGERLLSGLHRLKEKYPDVIADLRGRGLMIGVEFRRLTKSPSFVLRSLSSSEDLVFIVTGYLFNVHRIRVAPTLSDPFTVRLEPSAFIRDEDINRFFAAMDDVCARLQNNDALGLTAYLINAGSCPCRQPASVRADWKLIAYDEARFRQSKRSAPRIRVAWLFHLIDGDDLVALEPPFGNVSIEMREEYLDRFGALANPVVMSAVDVRSRAGDKVRLYPIMLPVTSRWMKSRIDARNLGPLRTLVQMGIDVAHCLGCTIVSLGQYTSIATLNGTSVALSNMGLTTGNSYTIALAIQAIHRAHSERGSDPAESVLAVAGAGGNIGRTCAEILAPRYRRAILIGSNKTGSWLGLQELSRKIPNAEITMEPSAIGAADVVVAAMNTVDAPLGPGHFAQDAIVCDVSVPPSVRPGTSTIRPDLLVIKGGIVRLPFGEDLEIIGFPLPPGHTYGCMAEGILLGFEGVRDTTFTGLVTPQQVYRIEETAQRHGFELADYKTFCVFGSEQREELHVDAR